MLMCMLSRVRTYSKCVQNMCLYILVCAGVYICLRIILYDCVCVFVCVSSCGCMHVCECVFVALKQSTLHNIFPSKSNARHI